MTSLKGDDVELSPIPHLPLTPAKTDVLVPTGSAEPRCQSDGPEPERQESPDPEVLSQIALDEVGPPPDGGMEAWLVVIGAGLCTFCIFGFSTSFGQLQVYYLDHQLSSNTPSEVGWISSITVFLVSLGSIFSGRYFDTHGARKLLIAGGSLQVGAFVAIAFSKNYWQLFLSHTCVGLAGSLVYAPATAVAGQWFLHRRSTAVALVAAGSGLGGICYPLMLKSLIEKLNFRDALLIIAGFNAVCMLVANFTTKARLPPRAPPPWKALLKPWQDPRYTFFVVGTAVALINWSSPYFNAPVLAKSNHASSTVAGYAVVILQTGSFFGRVTCGPLADRFGVWKVFIGVGVASAITLLAFWTPYPLPDAPIVIGLFAYGALSGAFMSLIGAACAAISPVEEVGTRIGILWTCSGLPCLAGPVICGALVTIQNGRFSYAAIFCAVTILFGNLVTLSPVLTSRLAGAAMRKNAKKLEKGKRSRA